MLADEIRQSAVIIHPGRFAYLHAKERPAGKHFLVSEDADEITVVTEEKDVNAVAHEKDVKWFTLFEIRPRTPFLAVGFLAAITSAIAAQGLNVLVVSTFSKDYLFLREEDSETAANALRKLGFSVQKQYIIKR